MNRQLLYSFAIIFLSFLVSCQSSTLKSDITGLWLMSYVTVGEQNMTPVAKWTRINADGTYESGNGWLKNSEGSWSFNENEQTFSPKEKNGLEDIYGAFKVSMDEASDEMTWTREEDGMRVQVTLTRIDEIPQSPADAVRGLWDLESVHQNDEDITGTFDPDNQYYTFIRWDRIYVMRNTEGDRQSGYWHMNGHAPEITLLPHATGAAPESWRIEFTGDNELRMYGISDSNRDRLMTFSRMDSFPE